ncbi:hydroxyacid dehydrogenase [Actinophytocola xinjiangensis]|uniref:hydroxyacid dehydrogenase n=1 Tax=Actinophytocola xinjiangensis TaxID=485602 RepID=UPI000A050857|nr:hydroxyacid dehydrogenase [Actinophytocola xinjiangensis]
MTGCPDTLVCVPSAVRAAVFPSGVGDARLLDDPAGLADALPGTEILVTGWGLPALGAELLDRAPNLRLVAHLGASVKFLVTEELFARGVRVTQAGQAMARPVAEVALAFTLSLLHQLPRFDHALHTGARWAAAEQAPARHEILDCPIGVVGASRTGRAYLDLVRALGARVSISDPHCTDEPVLPLEDLLTSSRIVALHAPVLPETHHLLGARELALLPDGAGVVNTARSWLVDERALLAELRTGRLDAALDVFDDEPLPPDHEFRRLPNVLLTPHQAAGTVEGRVRQGRIVLAEIDRYRAGQPLRHEVTPDQLPRIG